jgi:hypothetical protein
MFKPVRVVASIIFLSMIVMIFISAFVLDNGTLCISKRHPVEFVFPCGLLKREMQSLSSSSILRSSGTHYRTFPMRVKPSSRCSAWHNLTPPLPPRPSLRLSDRRFSMFGHVVTIYSTFGLAGPTFCQGLYILSLVREVYL